MKRFGTDGIRGRANRDVTVPLAMAVGAAVAREVGARVAVAHDGRPSGPMLEAAVVAGIAARGGTAVRLGVLPTPALAWLVARGGYGAGVMITASHNPPADNGLKVVDGRGEKVGAAVRERLERAIAEALTSDSGLSGGAPAGRVESDPDAGSRYRSLLLDALAPFGRLDGRRVVVDAANGAAHALAPGVLRALGAEVRVLGEGDGARMNVGCGVMAPEALAREVLSTGADAGIALDGDADRVLLLDSRAHLYDGDHLLWLGAWERSRAGDGPGVVVGTVMSNAGLESALGGIGWSLVRTPVGDAEVAAGMRAAHALLGGEPSGHLLWRDGPPTADGMYAGLRALLPDPRGLAERASAYRPYAQAHRTVPTGVGSAPTVPNELIAAIEAEGARVVVRPSGTEPVVRVMVEHAERAQADAGADRLAAALLGWRR